MITLIEKKGEDMRFLKNWRPISLTNIDAKIASKCLLFKLETSSAARFIVTRPAYVKGIGESARLINSILQHTDRNYIETLFSRF